jgi:hypothetical protein
MIMGAEEEKVTWGEIVNFMDEINQLFKAGDFSLIRTKLLSLTGEHNDNSTAPNVFDIKQVN